LTASVVDDDGAADNDAMYEYLLIPVCFDKNQQDDTVDGNTSHG
jgi:hypothetical protein